MSKNIMYNATLAIIFMIATFMNYFSRVETTENIWLVCLPTFLVSIFFGSFAVYNYLKKK